MTISYPLDATIDEYYRREGKSRAAFFALLGEEKSAVPHGKKREFEEHVAARCRKNGEAVSARTVRAWIDSVSMFTRAEIDVYQVLPFRLLAIACEIAGKRGDVTPQTILNWCVDNIGTNGADCEAVQAVWLPNETTDAGEVIPNRLASLWRYRVKLQGKDRKRWELHIKLMSKILDKKG